MRTRITMMICLCLLFAGRASAQWVVSDPGNLAQGIDVYKRQYIDHVLTYHFNQCEDAIKSLYARNYNSVF